MPSEFFTALSDLAVRLSSKLADKTFTLKFDLADDGVYRLVVQQGKCTVDRACGEATVTINMQTAQEATALLAGTLNLRQAVDQGTLAIDGDWRPETRRNAAG